MGGTEPRILAVTNSASLVIGLTFSHRGWDVASQTPDAVTSLDADVVVFDLGTTHAGMDAARALEPSVRALVIGDEEPSEVPPEGVHVLVRPYTVDELADRVDQLLSPAVAAPATWVDPPLVGERGAPPAGSAAALDASPMEQNGPATPEVPSAESTLAPLELRQGDHHAAAVDGVSGSGGPTSGASVGGRGRRADRNEPRRSLSSRLFGRVADVPSERPSDPSFSEEQTASAAENDEVSPPTDAGPTTATKPDGLTVALHDDLAVEVAPDDDEDAGSGLERAAAPMPPPPPTPTVPPVAPAAAAATALLERRVIHVTEAATSAPPSVRPTRWRARGQRSGTASDRQLRERLARVLAATSELERLTDEVPLLTDLTALATAVVREVAAQLDADTVGLWRPADEGWRVVAHQGLTRHEARWTVPFDQPLFSEVHATGGALLLDPVDAVQAAVAGIGGAHTESFMAAAIAAGPGRYGILAVGRDRQLVESDLDTLGDLALEMAPGLAVAEQLARLRGPGTAADGATAAGADGRRPWRAEA